MCTSDVYSGANFVNFRKNTIYNFGIKMSRVGSTVGSVIFRNGSGSIREK